MFLCVDGNVSKVKILRKIITDKLSVAAQDILAAVDKTVSAYEEEVIRQRKQLEALQPEVTRTGGGARGVLGPLCCDEDEEDSSELPVMSSNQSPEDSKDPDYQIPSRGRCGRRKPGRPRVSQSLDRVVFRVRVLEDSQAQVLTRNVLKKSWVQEVQCARGLQETEFLDLLRSTFPQLSGDKLFDVFTSDRNKKLQPLKLQMFAPEEIERSIRSTGAGNLALYIRLKNEDEDELHLSRTNAGAVTSKHDDDDDLSVSGTFQNVGARRAKASCSISPSPEGAVETEGAQTLGERREPACSEAESGDSDTRTLASGVKTQMCTVCGVGYSSASGLIKHAWTHVDEAERVCGVCGEHFPSAEELGGHLKSYQQTHDCSYCGKRFFTVVSLHQHVTAHTGQRPHKCDSCQKSFAYRSMLNIHRWVHVADRPHRCGVCRRSFGLKVQLNAHCRIHTDTGRFRCNVCAKSLYDLRSLMRHRVTHSDERRYGCPQCGKRFKLPDTLKTHQKTHGVQERPFLCDVCCKTFIKKGSLKLHMKTHSGDRPHVCGVCGKGFITNGELKVHSRVHTGEAPYGCSECGRFFKRKTHLNNHALTHSGVKLFFCGVCGKGVSRQEHLMVHMRTHSGERPYRCTLCDKAFTQSHCLKKHMSCHQGAQCNSSQPEPV